MNLRIKPDEGPSVLATESAGAGGTRGLGRGPGGRGAGAAGCGGGIGRVIGADCRALFGAMSIGSRVTLAGA